MTPSLVSKLANLGEEAPVMGDADMLEHADRDDAVELPVDLAIVAELEADARRTGRSARARSSATLRCSSLDSVTPVTSTCGGLGEIERKSAPAGADVEDLHAGCEHELGGEVALLGGLRLLERHVRLLEIGAGILAVAVEEELVEAAVEVVVVLRRCAWRGAAD